MPRHGKPPQLKRLRDDSLLEISDLIVAGRHSSCGINLTHEEGASRKHARFNLKNGQLTITDLGSLNGTLVNGIEIDGTHVLKNSDIIIFDTDKYLLSIPKTKRSPEVTNSTADTVIANKAERINPESITPAIKIIADERGSLPANVQVDRQEGDLQQTDHASNTVEYLNSLPAPDMKRPVGMPEHNTGKNRQRWPAAMLSKKWMLPAIVMLVVIVVAYQLGLRGA